MINILQPERAINKQNKNIMACGSRYRLCIGFSHVGSADMDEAQATIVKVISVIFSPMIPQAWCNRWVVKEIPAQILPSSNLRRHLCMTSNRLLTTTCIDNVMQELVSLSSCNLIFFVSFILILYTNYTRRNDQSSCLLCWRLTGCSISISWSLGSYLAYILT